MQGLEQIEEDDSDTVFRDVIFLALAGFVAIVLLLLPHLNPPAKAEEEAPSPGNVIVEIRWPDEVNADVDLWVEAPGDKPVRDAPLTDTDFVELPKTEAEDAIDDFIPPQVDYGAGVVPPASSETVVPAAEALDALFGADEEAPKEKPKVKEETQSSALRISRNDDFIS